MTLAMLFALTRWRRATRVQGAPERERSPRRRTSAQVLRMDVRGKVRPGRSAFLAAWSEVSPGWCTGYVHVPVRSFFGAGPLTCSTRPGHPGGGPFEGSCAGGPRQCEAYVARARAAAPVRRASSCSSSRVRASSTSRAQAQVPRGAGRRRRGPGGRRRRRPRRQRGPPPGRGARLEGVEQVGPGGHQTATSTQASRQAVRMGSTTSSASRAGLALRCTLASSRRRQANV